MDDTHESTPSVHLTHNVMRHQYRELTEEEKYKMRDIKDHGLEFWCILDDLGASRELSLAKTRIEEAVMWAIKHVSG